ncbi:hypothetical protein GCM10027168_36700 [Streptomyces capparidis]
MLAAWMAAGAVMAATTAQPVVLADAEFARPAAPLPKAVTYDTAAVPGGARVRLTEETGDRTTRLTLRLRGLKPGRTYGVHVHTGPCGADPAAAGPHYQHRPDPGGPSSGDPRYANPRNEVWLDLTTDRRGDGTAHAVQQWRFRPGGARSLVVHEHGTSTHPGHAGTAGDRVACVTARFR